MPNIYLDVLPACDRSSDQPYDFIRIDSLAIRAIANAIAADPEAARGIVAAGRPSLWNPPHRPQPVQGPDLGAKAMTAKKPAPKLNRGTLVRRINSDYQMVGTIVSRFKKLEGHVRFVIQDDRGTLFIVSEKNIEVVP